MAARAPRSGEDALIAAFLRPFGPLARQGGPGNSGVLRGPGDDCAVVRASRGQKLIATTDAVFEGVHFDLRSGTAADAGHKALAVNLSDLAAAGARPRWFLCALGVPAGAGGLDAAGAVRLAAQFGRGMAPLARRHACALVGGNVSRAAQWSVTITALGEARRPLTRAGGRPGDALVVAGWLGAAALGLRELQAGAARSARAGRGALVRAQLRPTPLVAAGLAASGLASASIDVSDGLLLDLERLLAASGCAAEIALEELPLPSAVGRAQDAPRLALAGGEDYALLWAVPRRRVPRLLSRLRSLRVGARVIGRLLSGAGVRVLQNGAPFELPAARGFDHLRS